jgi:hypothetical protein
MPHCCFMFATTSFLHVTSSAILLMMRIKSRQGRPPERNPYGPAVAIPVGSTGVSLSCSQSELSNLLIQPYSQKQGCLHQSQQAFMQMKDLVCTMIAAVPVTSHGCPHVCSSPWTTRGRSALSTGCAEVAAVVTKVWCKLLARAVPLGLDL